MLKGKKVNLRLMRESDLDDYIRAQHDLDVRGPFFPMRVEAEPVIRAKFHEHGFWTDEFRMTLIVDKETDRMLGLIAGFSVPRYPDCVEIGYILHDTSRRGEGIMPEAVQLFCGYLFKLKNFYRIHLTTDSENMASRRTAEKAGFTHEGTLRQCLVIQGRPRDLEMYSILRSEFESQNPIQPS